MTYSQQSVDTPLKLGGEQSSAPRIDCEPSPRAEFATSRIARRTEHTRKALLWVSNSLLASMAVCLICGMVRWRETAANRTIGVDRAEQSFESVESGRILKLPFLLRNPTSRPVRILGSRGSCKVQGCFQVDGLPVTIPPSSELSLDVIVDARQPGRLEGEMCLWTDCAETRSLDLRIKGEVLPANSPSTADANHAFNKLR